MENTISENNQVQSTDDVVAEPTTSEQTLSENLFSQKQVDKIVAKRVADVKKQYVDYQELKDGQATLQATIEELQQKLSSENKKIEELAFESALTAVSSELGIDAKLAKKFIDMKSIIFDGDNQPTNLKQLLQKEIEEFPQLIRKGTLPNSPKVGEAVENSTPKRFSPYASPAFWTSGSVRLKEN